MKETWGEHAVLDKDFLTEADGADEQRADEIPEPKGEQPLPANVPTMEAIKPAEDYPMRGLPVIALAGLVLVVIYFFLRSRGKP